MKKGFTMVEMLIVVVVIALMISMIPFRMQSLQSRARFSLLMNDREDYWQKTVTHMRQSNKYKQATIAVDVS
jgi:prepilin-type N-terminal cleavage/methylation domain-containing protein